MSDDSPQHPIPDELKLDVDQDKLAKWDKVSEDYSGECEQEARRPVFTEDKPSSDNTGEDSAGTNDESGDAEEDSTDPDERDRDAAGTGETLDDDDAVEDRHPGGETADSATDT